MLPAGIEELNLEENSLYSDGLLEEWPDTLRILNLSRNPFCRIFPETSFPPSLRELNLSYLSIQELPTLPEGLTSLDIRATDIQRIRSLPSTLLWLNASASLMQHLPSKVPLGIQEVVLHNCKFRGSTGLPTNWGNALEVLVLSKNNLNQWPIGIPPTIRHLNLAENRIPSIPEKEYPALLLLNLHGNHIQRIPSGFGSAKLPLILLSDNCLISVTLGLAPGILTLEGQWNTAVHKASARQIQRFWRIQRMRRRLKAIRRSVQLREGLLAVAMHPDRVGQFEEISPNWRK